MDIGKVGDHECIECGECIAVCPTKAISWKGSKIFLHPNAVAASVAAEETAGGEDFAIGDRVRHAKFGEGLVIDQDDKTMTVIFDAAGQKKMAKGIAPLKKI